MNVINLCKNNFKRILAQKAVVIVALVVVPIMIGLGVLFSAKTEMKPHIALVTNGGRSLPKNDKIQIDVMDKKPAESKLLLGEYAAIAEEKSDGTYKVTTLKSKDDKKKIEEFLRNSKIIETQKDKDAKRGTGANILGFMMLSILMEGLSLILLFPEDRTLKTFRRIMTGPVSERQYILSQGIFTFLFLYLPSYLAIIITKVCFGVKIGFDYGMLAILVAILSALSTAFALFFSVIFEREISITASGIYTITSILAGCFYSFTGGNKILDAVCKVIPQKEYMTISQGVENGSSILSFKGELIYLFVWIAGLWFLGSFITSRKVKRGIY